MTIGDVSTLAIHTGPLDFEDCTQAHLVVSLPPTTAMNIKVKVQTGDVSDLRYSQNLLRFYFRTRKADNIIRRQNC